MFTPPARMPTFAAALRDVAAEGFEFRRRAAARLSEPAEDGHSAARAGLAVLAGDPHPLVREDAIRSLASLGHPDDFQLLCDCLSDPAPSVREAALVAVAGRDDPGSEDILEASLESPHPELRFQAVYALALRNPARVHRWFPTLLTDADAHVRLHTVLAMGATVPENPATSPDSQLDACKELLGPCLTDGDEAVRWEAAFALASLSDARGLPVLLANLAHRDRGLSAALCLAELGAHSALGHDAPLAKAALRRTLRWRPFADPYRRVAAAVALIMLGDLHGVAPLRRALRRRWNPARGFAVDLAGRFRIRPVRQDLADLAVKPQGLPETQITEALLQIPTRDYLERPDQKRSRRRRPLPNSAA